MTGRFRFDHFALDPDDRRLTRDGAPVELSARYLDALALLVGEDGRLVTKDRFMAEVWRGVPVTDEALTQCIKELRRALGDDAARPRFIETVPKHGYRFIMPVEGEGAEGAASAPGRQPWQDALLLGGAGVIGGGLAGGLIGILYGFASVSPSPGTGAASVLLVLLCLAILAALIGALGIMAGIASTMVRSGRPGPWSIAGGAAGGLVMGRARCAAWRSRPPSAPPPERSSPSPAARCSAAASTSSPATFRRLNSGSTRWERCLGRSGSGRSRGW